MEEKIKILSMSNNENIQRQILEVIKKNLDKIKADKINPMTEFSNNGLDSIDYLEVAVKLEQVFDFQFEDNKLVFGNFNNILSMTQYVESRIMRLMNIQQVILDIVNKCVNEETSETIDFHTDFPSAGIDSVKFIEIALKIEETFDFEFDDEKLVFGALNNINAIAKYIESNSIRS